MHTRNVIVLVVTLLTVTAVVPPVAVGAVADGGFGQEAEPEGTSPTPTPTTTPTATPTTAPTTTSTTTPTATPTATPTTTPTATPTTTPTGEQDPRSTRGERNPRLSSGVVAVAERAVEEHGSSGSRTQGFESGPFITVRIESEPGRASTVASAVAGRGGAVHARAGDVVEARIPAGALYALADDEGVAAIRRPVASHASAGAVTSEGIENMSVPTVHAQGVNGSGVHVAVIDHGFDATNADIADNVAEVKSFQPGSFVNETGQHGTAVAELVVDTAPNVTLHLYNASTDTQIINAIDHIDSRGDIDVASMSLGFLKGPFDGESDVDAEVAQSVGSETTWFVSSGNYARAHHNSTWRDEDGDDRHEFAASDEALAVDPKGASRVDIYVNWNDWHDGGTVEDYDVVVKNDSGATVGIGGSDTQDGSSTSEPIEWVTVTDASTQGPLTVEIRNVSANGTASFDVFVAGVGGSPQVTDHPDAARSVTRPATEETALAVGAVYWNDLTKPEPFSSQGPPIDGDRKPEVVAPDGVSTSTTGYSEFFGTSAAAPHAAGVGALLLSADGSLTPDGLRANLTSTTDLVQGDEPNNQTGYGLVNATAAVDSVLAAGESGDTTPPDVSAAGAFDLTNGDGEVAGGDEVKVNVTVTDDTAVDVVMADARDFGAGNVTLTDPDADGVFNATFLVDAAEASADGPYEIPVTANDTAGNENGTTTNALTLSTGGDTTKPVLSEATALDTTTDLQLLDDSGVAGDGDVIEVGVAVSDASPVTVTTNASALGGPDPVSLTDGNADGVYNGTFTVDATSAGATDGEYTLTVNATDDAGNWNTTTATLTLDTTAPLLSNGVTTSDNDASPNLVGAGGLLNVSADASDANAVEVRVDASAVGHGSNELLGDADEDGTYDTSLSIAEEVPDNTYTFTVSVTDAAGNTNTTTTDDVVVDTTAPSLSNVALFNATDMGTTVEQGDTAEVRAEASDTRLRDVVADVSALGGSESLTLTDGNADGVYNATFTVGAVSDGTYTASVTAEDDATNTNASQSNEVTVGTPDTTAPELANAGAFDLTNGDGEVADGDSVKVNVTATDDNVVDSVSVDASNFGAGTVSLVDEDGDDVWNATFTVGSSGSLAADGTQSMTFTAADSAGNTNTTTASLVVNTTSGGGGDTTAPTVSNFAVQIDMTTPLAVDVLFDSDEQVADIEVVVTNASGATVATLTEAELSESSYGGTYTYFHRFTFSETGTYDVTLTKAADAAGNDGSNGESATVRQVVESYSVEHVGGTAPDLGNLTQNVYVPQGGSLLQVQLRDADDSGESVQNRTELSDIGFASDTRMRINVTVGDGFVPRLVLGAARNGSYTITDNGDGTMNLSVEVEPAAAQLLTARMSGGPYGDWPAPATEDTADEAYTAIIDLAVDEMVHVSSPDDYNGTMILTDAQELGTPTATTTGSGDPALRLFVAGPHNTTQGTLNTGFYETFLPNSLLNSWGVTDPSQLQVNAIGSDVTPTRTQTSGGVKLDVPIHYSSGNVDVSGSSSSDTTPPSVSSATLTDATDGNGLVADGDSLAVAADVSDPNLQSVTVDASAFGTGTVSLSDGDGDGTYDATITVDDASAGADGDHALTVTATDTGGNTNTADTASVTLDTTAPTAEAGSDQTVNPDTAVSFDASASGDANGVASYAWDFGDGSSGTGVSTSHTYTTSGEKTVTLTVTDAAGNTATDTAVVTVVSVRAPTSSGGGGGGGGGVAPAPTTAEPTPEPTPTADETTPTVTTSGEAAATVTRTGTGVTVEVTGAAGTERVDVSLPAADVAERLSTDGVALESLSTTFARDTDFAADVSSSTEPVDGTPAVARAVGYVTVDTGDGFEEADVSEVRFGFAVGADRLDERGLAPEDVVLYRYHDGEWTELETRVVGEEGETVRFEAVSPGLSTFAIGDRTALDEEVTGDDQVDVDTGADADDSDDTEDTNRETTATTDVTTDRESPTAGPGTPTNEWSGGTEITSTSTPGFGPVVALVALLLSVAALWRRD